MFLVLFCMRVRISYFINQNLKVFSSSISSTSDIICPNQGEYIISGFWQVPKLDNRYKYRDKFIMC